MIDIASYQPQLFLLLIRVATAIIAITPAARRLHRDRCAFAARAIALVAASGTTAQRPTYPVTGSYVDTQAAVVVAWDDANQRNIVSGAIA
jgi:hypothetical protein